MDETTLARFLAKVEKQTEVTSPYVDTPCWLWTAWTDRRGYGYFNFKRSDGLWRSRFAHRAAYQHWNGKLGKLCCLHRCDNPSCVNPRHLFAGTHADNVADKVAKGRQQRGEKVRGSRLTRADVLSIRRRSAGGESDASIARSFGVCRTAVSMIARGLRWAHVGGPLRGKRGAS